MYLLQRLMRNVFQRPHRPYCDEPGGFDDPVGGVNPPHARVGLRAPVHHLEAEIIRVAVARWERTRVGGGVKGSKFRSLGGNVCGTGFRGAGFPDDVPGSITDDARHLGDARGRKGGALAAPVALAAQHPRITEVPFPHKKFETKRTRNETSAAIADWGKTRAVVVRVRVCPP